MTKDTNPPINLRWRKDAACKGEDMTSFFPVAITKANIDETTRIYLMCQRCPVIVDCMHEALLQDYDGIWARSTTKQRQSYIKYVLNNNVQDVTREEVKRFVDDLCSKNIAPNKIYIKRSHSLQCNPAEEPSKTQTDSSNDKDI